MDVSTRPAPSARANRLLGANLAELFLLARERGAVDLATGVPELPTTPAVMIQDAAAALHAGLNQYDDPSGMAGTRRRFASLLPGPVDPDREVTVTVGATEGLFAALMSVVDPGDEVVLLEPFYPNFLSAVRLAGAVPKTVRLTAPGWQLDPERLASVVGPRTKALIVNSPNNPTGSRLTRSDFEHIAEVCERWNVTVIADEVYSEMVFDGGTHLSVAEVPGLRDRSIVLRSLSKSHAVSGWRLGFAWARPELTRAFRRVHEIMTQGATTPLQAAVTALALSPQATRRSLGEMTERRDLLQGLLAAAGLTFAPAQGGCFVLADIRRVTEEDSESYTHRVMREQGVLFAPGTSFFLERDPGTAYVRAAFNKSLPTLSLARARLLGRPAIGVRS